MAVDGLGFGAGFSLIRKRTLTGESSYTQRLADTAHHRSCRLRCGDRYRVIVELPPPLHAEVLTYADVALQRAHHFVSARAMAAPFRAHQ